MTRNQQIRTIHDAFNEIPDLQDGFHDVSRRLYDMNERSERDHRKHRPYSLPRERFTVSDAAKLFTVQHLLDGWAEAKWTVNDITSIRNECLYAQAYATRFHEELRPWATKWLPLFKDVDYAELMKAVA